MNKEIFRKYSMGELKELSEKDNLRFVFQNGKLIEVEKEK